MSDNVNHPDHYNKRGIECIEAIEASLAESGLDPFVAYCLGNAFKYIYRAPYKGKTTEDIKKAVWYLQRAIKERLEVSTQVGVITPYRSMKPPGRVRCMFCRDGKAAENHCRHCEGSGWVLA